MDKQVLIEKAKAYAAERYELGYGWEVFTECYGAAEWDDFMDGNEYEDAVTTWSEAKAKLHNLADLVSDHYDDIVSEAF
jgi:hypothetical protein